MLVENDLPEQNKLTLAFKDKELESEFKTSYDKSVRIPLRYGIIVSILSWYSAIFLIYAIIPQEFSWFGTLTFFYITSFFGFLIYSTFKERFTGYYHFLGACSNAWAGIYTIYFCDQFPNGENLILPVLIFIIFFGSYMIRLRWIAGFVAALSYIIVYHLYIALFTDLPSSQVLLYAFVGWMTLIFALIAGRVSERNHRLLYIQRKTIREQSEIIEKEKVILLKEVHHRVKNNLQIIVSLINLQLSKFDNKEIEVALKETQSRVMSMSLVHQRMHHTSGFSEVLLLDYSGQLIGKIKHLFEKNGPDFDLQIDKDITIDIETAIPLGLIINEIVSNFFKHCAMNSECKFKIEVKKSGENKYLLKYSDNGSGFPEGTQIDDSNTLGLDLIDSLTEQINGDFKFHNENGAVYEVSFTV